MKKMLKLITRAIVFAGFIFLIIVGFSMWMPKACTQTDETKRVLSEQGYTEIEITGWRPMMQSDNESFSTGFQAKSPNGIVVTGAVTSRWFGGKTIRLD